MASGHVNRIKRPNTWLHRPMLQNVKKLLPTRSRPHMALTGPTGPVWRCPLAGVDRKWRFGAVRTVFYPDRTSADALGFMSFHARSRAVTCAAAFVL